jgi:4-hydroxy-3-methylbut-2-enyl diphosphate reductase LytB-like protein
VHNRHVVEALRAKGAHFVDELDEVPDDTIVIFSAHGISPAVRAEAHDAACGSSTRRAPSSPRCIWRRCATPARGTRSSWSVTPHRMSHGPPPRQRIW